VCVRDTVETDLLCACIRGEIPADTIRTRFAAASSPGFDPDIHLARIGLANQTTMLMSESLEIEARLRAAMRDRYGEAALADRFRAFDTICSATQDRQDAVRVMLASGGLDVMIVIGGYNSSNTQALAGMCAPQLPTYHVDGAHCLDADAIRYRPVGGAGEATASGWLRDGAVAIGLTAGASTPDSVVGRVVERLLALRGRAAADLLATRPAATVSECV
jgi:4-hydroxy-3-methylbut-2-enyl diphosphate reductase